MALLPPVTRDAIPADLRAIWDECEQRLPTFRHLWATQAHSPTVFRHVWSQLLELKRDSPVAARQFELAIVVVSSLNRCGYCVAHHAPLATATGVSAEQVTALQALALGPLPDGHDFPPRAGFSAADSLVIDLAWFLVWSGTWAPLHGVHPGLVQRLRRRLYARLAAVFSPRQVEELVWRTAQCVAFNWHNEFLELDVEPGVASVDVAAATRP